MESVDEGSWSGRTSTPMQLYLRSIRRAQAVRRGLCIEECGRRQARGRVRCPLHQALHVERERARRDRTKTAHEAELEAARAVVDAERRRAVERMERERCEVLAEGEQLPEMSDAELEAEAARRAREAMG